MQYSPVLLKTCDFRKYDPSRIDRKTRKYISSENKDHDLPVNPDGCTDPFIYVQGEPKVPRPRLQAIPSAWIVTVGLGENVLRVPRAHFVLIRRLTQLSKHFSPITIDAGRWNSLYIFSDRKWLRIVLRLNEEADLVNEEDSSPRNPSSAPGLFLPPEEGNLLPAPPPPPSDPLRSMADDEYKNGAITVCLITVQ